MKRVWKKMAALLMMMAMVLAMGTTAGAAAATTTTKGTIEVSPQTNSDGVYYVTNSASVEITGAPTDGTIVDYATYQVIYATYDSTTNELTWNLTSWAETALTTDNWYLSSNYTHAKYDSEDDALAAVLALTDQTGSKGTEATEQNSIVNTLAEYIAYAAKTSAVSEYSTTWSTTSGTSSSTLELGSYLVIPTATDYSFLNMLVSVDVSDTPTSTDPAASTASDGWVLTAKGAVLKGNKLTIAKTVSETKGATGSDNADAQVGDTLYYSLTVYVPKFAANDSQHIFYVTDVATNLKIDESSVVVTPYYSSIGSGIALTAGSQYTKGVSTDVNKDTLTVSFTDQYYDVFYSNGTYPYEFVIITYQAELLSSAVTYENNGNSNEATLTYNYDNHTANTAKSAATVYTYSLDLTKYGENSALLSNASFRIYYYDAQGNQKYLRFIQNTDGSYSVADSTDEADPSITKYDAVTTSSDGTLTLTGLNDDVEYFIVESVAPSGYSLNTNILKFKITEDSTTAGTINTITAEEYTTYTYNGTNNALLSGTTWKADKHASNSAQLTMSVTDTKLSALPATGSVGIIVFTIAGVAIMILALVLINSGKSKQKKA